MVSKNIAVLTRNQAEDLLRVHFGLNRFYDEQWETINGLLKGHRILLIQRTGFGKSLCYQFPAILFNGTTVIFSPLIALMRDQVQHLKSLGLSVECINSEQTNEENKTILRQARQNRIKILYIAPERQESLEWLDAVREIKLSMIVIDEAHCISVWGHDFRPAFRKIIDLVKLLPKDFPVLATTATATERVSQDIMQQMGENVKYLRGDLLRKNFRLNVARVFSEDDKLAFLAQYLPKMEGTGIIYTGTRVNTEVYSNFLKYQGIDVVNYNAGFDPETRRYIEAGLFNNRWKCVVATNALGMGIDKPDLRFIIHSQIPASPIHYYQEIGRAGRDGKEALIILLYNPEDRELPEHFIENSRPPLKHYQRVIGELRNEPLGQWYLMRKTNLPRTKIEVILADLIDQGLLSETVYGRSKRYEYQFNAPPFDNMVVERLRDFKLKELEKMVEYAEADRCRMFYLCDYLEDKKADNCHNCDICRGKKLTYKINAYWQQRVDDFKDNYFPKIELVTKPQPGKFLSERKNKLINGIAFSYYGFSSVGATIHRCKYENGGNFPDFLLKGVLKAYRTFFKEEKFDLIVYAPPTESGNLVKNFAERIATALKIPISHGLVKLRNTEPQKLLQNSTLKRDNVKGAFSYDNPFEVVGKNVLLIDDICDSKATIREIGSLMTKLGVNKIAPLVIAKTIGGDLIEDKPDFPEKDAQLYSRKAIEEMAKREPFAEVRKSYPRTFEKWTKDEEQIYQALRKWRLKKAEESDLPAYCVLSNATLHNIAKTKPSSLWELLEIKGLGKKTIKKFGEEIIEIMIKLAK